MKLGNCGMDPARELLAHAAPTVALPARNPSNRGGAHHCKLTAEAVRNIRAAVAAGSTVAELACKYPNVSLWTLYAAARGRNWREV